MHFPGPVRGDDDNRWVRGANRPDLRDGDLKVRQQFQQVALEFLVRAIDLVDEQNGGLFGRCLDGLQQRPFDQECFGKEIPGEPAADLVAVGGLAQRRFEQPNFEDLARVVPLVDRMRDVEALITLQPDQRRPERGGEDLGQLRLADPGFAFEEERPLQSQREVHRNREGALGHVVLTAKRLLQVFDRVRQLPLSQAWSPSARRAAASERHPTLSATPPARKSSACPGCRRCPDSSSSTGRCDPAARTRSRLFPS